MCSSFFVYPQVKYYGRVKALIWATANKIAILSKLYDVFEVSSRTKSAHVLDQFCSHFTDDVLLLIETHFIF